LGGSGIHRHPCENPRTRQGKKKTIFRKVDCGGEIPGIKRGRKGVTNRCRDTRKKGLSLRVGRREKRGNYLREEKQDRVQVLKERRTIDK